MFTRNRMFNCMHKFHRKCDSYEQNYAMVLLFKCITLYSEMQVVDIVTTLTEFCSRFVYELYTNYVCLIKLFTL